MKKLFVTVVALTVGLLAFTPAHAGMGEKTGNTIVNATLGAAECPKAWADEVSRGGERSVIGFFITGPLMCGTNVAVRYLGVAADLLTLPVGDNVIQPNVLDPKPPVRLP